MTIVRVEDIDPYYRLTVEQVESLAHDLQSFDKKTRMDALQHLGKFVVEPAEALITYIVEGNCMETLMVRLHSLKPFPFINSPIEPIGKCGDGWKDSSGRNHLK